MADLKSRGRGWNRTLPVAATAAAGITAAYFGYTAYHDYTLGRELVLQSPDSISAKPELVSYAQSVGQKAYAANCAACHGADMKGSQTKGIPNLIDNIWLYDYGRVSDIERTILYGIRAGLGKSHNVTDMPAIGRQKVLTTGEIRDVMAYVLSLNVKNRTEDRAA